MASKGNRATSEQMQAGAAPPRPSPATPLVTPPLPEAPVPFAERDVSALGPHVVTGLREYDGAMEWELSRSGKRFFGGASRDCEISVPGRGLSATHFLLERRGLALRLYDQHSKHGTWVMDSLITTADLRPGSKFTAMPVTFVALNDAMRRHRPLLVEILGAQWVHSPDWMIVEAVGAGPLVITGQPGCGQEGLARAIHEMSPRSERELIELDQVPEGRAAEVSILKSASKQATTVGSTVVLKLGPKPARLDPTFVSMLCSPAYGIRMIVLADDPADARHALGEDVFSLCQPVGLRPLAYRAEEIDQLLNRMFEERGAPHLRAADLTAENQAAARAYNWPGNLDELRRVADVIVAHEAHGGWRGASEALGRAKSTIQDDVERVGMMTSRQDANRHSLFEAASRQR
jgi:hypothetical protein